MHAGVNVGTVKMCRQQWSVYVARISVLWYTRILKQQWMVPMVAATKPPHVLQNIQVSLLFVQTNGCCRLPVINTYSSTRKIHTETRKNTKLTGTCIQTIYSVVLGNFGKGNQGSFAIMCSDVHKSTLPSPRI